MKVTCPRCQSQTSALKKICEYCCSHLKTSRLLRKHLAKCEKVFYCTFTLSILAAGEAFLLHRAHHFNLSLLLLMISAFSAFGSITSLFVIALEKKLLFSLAGRRT